MVEPNLPVQPTAVPGWEFAERDGVVRLERVFTFPDFAAALAFTNRVGALAERENHHPSLVTEWGRVLVAWWTHTSGHVEERDRRLALATSALYTEPLSS